ncbi:MAG: hypothetical protein RMJ55_15530 [Roseiflexaceae bacterium]|nr:hypothetical protein [Roseiflexus sp.]MDW8214967.1 hypothetical protein [Roseiflexaceae bacterium]
MTKNDFDAIQITRRIREDLYEQIKNKTLAERIAFYHQQAQAFHRQLGLSVPISVTPGQEAVRTNESEVGSQEPIQ